MALLWRGNAIKVGRISPAQHDTGLSADGIRTVSLGVSGILASAGLLYLAAVWLLLFGPGQLPDYTYNWEHYTAYDVFRFWDGSRPLSETFIITDGLMTDSGESPFVALPVLVGWRLAGVGLTAMRVATVVIAALAVPMLWFFARRLAGEGVALVSAALLAVSPGFLLYGRTATIVGLSVGVALFTAHALLQVLRPDPRAWVRSIWLGTFLLMLVVNAYAYSPIRFFWPLALVAILVEVLFRRQERSWLLPAGVLILVWLPLVLMGMRAAGWTNRPAEFDLFGTVSSHYFARGEQIFNLLEQPEGIEHVLDDSEAEEASDSSGNSAELALRLVRENARDLGNLLLDRETRPALTDHWNAHGRLQAGLLVPGIIIGCVILAVQVFRRVEARFLLELAAVFTLPMLLTTNVHVGRLIFAIPFLTLIAVIGYAWMGGWVVGMLDRWRSGARVVLWPVGPVGAGLLILLVARATWHEMAVSPTPSPNPDIVATLAVDAATGESLTGAAYVAGDTSGEEVEALDVAAYRLQLNDTYQFVNVARDETMDAADPRPPLYYGGLLDQIGAAERLPDQCAVTYYVRPRVEAELHEQLAATQGACDEPPRVVILDG
jgi:hypothetical protein